MRFQCRRFPGVSPQQRVQQSNCDRDNHFLHAAFCLSYRSCQVNNRITSIYIASCTTKPRVDAYGGGAAFITVKEIRTMSTAAWLNEQQARLGALNQHHSGMGTGVGCNSSSWFLFRI